MNLRDCVWDTQFTLLSERPTEGFLWSERRLTKRQATSRSDHLWPKLRRGLARNAKLREKQKWAIEKPKLDNARRLQGIYFIEPEDKESKETIKNARRKIWNTNGSRCALQDKQEKQAWGDPWQNQWVQIKTRVYLGSQWIHKTAYGRIRTKISCGPYCRKREQFTATLQFGTQIYSYASSHEESRSKSSSG